jgi:hypothetical protein
MAEDDELFGLTAKYIIADESLFDRIVSSYAIYCDKHDMYWRDGAREAVTDILNEVLSEIIFMTVSITAADGADSDPLECTVIGKRGASAVELKDELDEVIISTLKAHNDGSGNYHVEIQFCQNGKYLDGDDSGICYCELDTGTVKWASGESLNSARTELQE